MGKTYSNLPATLMMCLFSVTRENLGKTYDGTKNWENNHSLACIVYQQKSTFKKGDSSQGYV